MFYLQLKHFKISILKHESDKEFHIGTRRKINKCLQIFVLIKGITILKRSPRVQTTAKNRSAFSVKNC